MPSAAALIAIVENDETARHALHRLIAASGFDVEAFGSAAEYLAKVDEIRPDCVLIEIHLGAGLGGFDLAKELMARDRRTPILLMTASLHPSHAHSAAELGSCTLLCKPFADEELLAALNYALTVPR